jgi:hypothetical protein
MLSSNELNKCIELLADINTMTNDRNIKTKLLEIGYTLKKELDNTSLIESMDRDINNRVSNMGTLDVKRLLEDNVQLFNEKERVLKQNKELREILDSKLQIYETKLGMITNTMSDVKQTIEALRR